MPFLNFCGDINKHCNLSDMKNMKNRYSDPDPDPDPLWNRIRGSGSRSTFPKCGSPDPDPRQNEMDPKRCLKPKIHPTPCGKSSLFLISLNNCHCSRYILESSLLEYKMNVQLSESLLAASALVLAFKIKGIEVRTHFIL